MKRSDKVLLTAFLLGLFILLGVQAALYAKYKKGDFVYLKDSWQQLMVTIPTRDIAYISVDHTPQVTIEAADSTRLEWLRTSEQDSSLTYKRVGDTLFISGDRNSERSYNSRYGLTLKLASPVTLLLKSADLGLQGNNSKTFPDVHIMADSSDLDFSGRNEQIHPKFALLDIKAANQSKVNLASLSADKIIVQLLNSKIDEQSATIDSVRLTADPGSKIGLRMLNLSKAKITTTNE